MPSALYDGIFMIVWKSRQESNTSWKDNSRDKRKTKSRKYMLGSFFELVKTALTDPKDNKALWIKCDPAYLADSEYWVREEANTTWKTRFRS